MRGGKEEHIQKPIYDKKNANRGDPGISGKVEMAYCENTKLCMSLRKGCRSS